MPTIYSEGYSAIWEMWVNTCSELVEGPSSYFRTNDAPDATSVMYIIPKNNELAAIVLVSIPSHCIFDDKSGKIVCGMATVVITSVDPRNSRRYLEVMKPLGVEVRLLLPDDAGASPTEVLMGGVDGLLLPGGPDVDPNLYGADPDPEAGLDVCRPLDELDLRLLDYALQQDLSVLAISRGMQLLNVAFGGQLIQDLPDHRTEWKDGEWVSKIHLTYLSPGSKAAAVIGAAGFFRVNSRHHQGLHEAQRSPRLMTTAYAVEDGIIEGLESPEHRWVIGMQCRPELQDEVPRLFANLFAAFGERAVAHSQAESS